MNEEMRFGKGSREDLLQIFLGLNVTGKLREKHRFDGSVY
jgi:hypothetical protein